MDRQSVSLLGQRGCFLGGVLCCLGSTVFGSLCLCSNLFKCENRGQARGPLHHHLSAPSEHPNNNNKQTFENRHRKTNLGSIIGTSPSCEGDVATDSNRAVKSEVIRTFTARGGPERLVGGRSIISLPDQQLNEP